MGASIPAPPTAPTEGTTLKNIARIGRGALDYGVLLPLTVAALPFMQYDLDSNRTLGGFTHPLILKANRLAQRLLS